jgi:hypothetical protein
LTERYAHVAPSHLHSAVQTLSGLWPATHPSRLAPASASPTPRVAAATYPCDRTADREVSPAVPSWSQLLGWQ